jgi:hypothetical protein
MLSKLDCSRFAASWKLSAVPLRSKFLGSCFSDKVFRDSVAKKSVPQRGSVWVDRDVMHA